MYCGRTCHHLSLHACTKQEEKKNASIAHGVLRSAKLSVICYHICEIGHQIPGSVKSSKI